MRILALRTKRFGGLVNRTFPLDDRAFCVLGPNEAGKSSFHSAIETALYGFDPPARDRHPYARLLPPNEALHVEADVAFEVGGRDACSVERTMSSRPYSRRTALGSAFEGARNPRNDALQELRAFPRAVFRAVYSLTANDAAEPSDDVKDHVEELLLGDLGLPGLVPMHVVRARLEEDRKKLWRSDRKGEPRARRIAQELEAARAEHRAAQRRERELVQAEEELVRASDELAELEAERRGLDHEIGELELLAELAALEAEERVHAERDLSGFDAVRLEDPAPLRERIQGLESEREAPSRGWTEPR